MTEEIKVESGIPIPIPKANLAKYPVRDMDVGDSFFVKVDDAGIAKKRNSIAASFRHAGKKSTIRKVDGGLRVWRVE